MVVMFLLEFSVASSSAAAAGNPFAFSNTLTDHAVVSLPFTVWGTGTPGSTVDVTVAKEGLSSGMASVAEVGADGVWRQDVSGSMAEGFDVYTINAKSSSTTITLTVSN